MRKLFVLGLTAVLALAIASPGFGANTQTIDATFSPKKLDKFKYTGGKINVLTTTGDPDGDIAAAQRAKVFFDDDLLFFTKGVPTCLPGQIEGKTAAAARAVCSKAMVGSGNGQVAPAGNPNSPLGLLSAVVTAFNGKPKNGKPVILLHTYEPQVTGDSKVLIGTLKNATGDFGKVLDVIIPEFPGGTAITRFEVTVQKKFKFRGRTRNYVSARCNDNNRKLNYKGTFFFDDGTQKTATDAQTCTRG